MNHQTQHADEVTLQALIFGDEQQEGCSPAAIHVENCDVCLGRLNELAATKEFDLETRQWLSQHSESENTDRSTSAPVIPDCLGPPSHPEMLGRLGRYEVERVIGAGGMGVVLKGYDSELSRPVAVKLLAQHLAHSGAARQRFAREARAAAAVVHEHVVAIHNVETDGEYPFLVMQYVSGESLQARVDREGPMDSRQILRIGIQAAGGLAAAHEQGVIHRDVKPANILLEDGVERVLLTDFGLARTVDDASLTNTGIVTGTPHYMSPEQASGEISDQRTDLFSLGSALYFMATGHPPFRAERAMGVLHRICNDRHRPAWEVNSDISDELSDVIDSLLEKKASRRVASAALLRERLVLILERIQQPRPWWARRTRRFILRYRARVVPAVAVLAVSATAALFFPGQPLFSPVGDESQSGAIATNTTSSDANADEVAARESEATVIPDTSAASGDTNVRHDTGADAEFAGIPAVFEDERARRQATSEFDRSIANIRRDVDALSAERQGTFLNPVADDWSAEVSAIHAVLNEFDNQW